MYKVAPQLTRLDQLHAGPMRPSWPISPVAEGAMSGEPFRSPVTDFYMTNPIARASQHHGRVLGPEERAKARGGGVGP